MVFIQNHFLDMEKLLINLNVYDEWYKIIEINKSIPN
jgi:hypothetical protein